MDLDREDLVALVDMLQHEHFPYSGRGARAARALEALEDLVTAGGMLFVDGPAPKVETEIVTIGAVEGPLLDDDIPF